MPKSILYFITVHKQLSAACNCASMTHLNMLQNAKSYDTHLTQGIHLKPKKYSLQIMVKIKRIILILTIFKFKKQRE